MFMTKRREEDHQGKPHDGENITTHLAWVFYLRGEGRSTYLQWGCSFLYNTILYSSCTVNRGRIP
jgi:hypothetical protein